jgi:hypothetical protein
MMLSTVNAAYVPSGNRTNAGGRTGSCTSRTAELTISQRLIA